MVLQFSQISTRSLQFAKAQFSKLLVLSPQCVSEAQSKFEGCEQFTLKPEWIVRISYKPEGKGDYLAVVLQPEAVTFLEKQNLIFLKVKSAKAEDQIIVMGYPDDETDNPKMSSGYGSVHTIDGFTIIYCAATADGSSGSPLVLWTGEAIGIHRSQYKKDDTPIVESPPRYATSLAEIKENLFLDIGKLKYFNMLVIL